MTSLSNHRWTFFWWKQRRRGGHVSPEATVCGPISLVLDGDIIILDIDKGSINLDLSTEELNRRKASAEFKLKLPKQNTGYLKDMLIQYHQLLKELL